LKCIDTETNKVVGMALYDVYIAPSDWKKGEIGWLQGKERERAEALVKPLWDAREKLWLNERYIYCHVMAVHPEYQRKGIGEMIFKYGMSISEQTGLPTYIESSGEGVRLYEKMGSRRLKEKVVHRSEDISPEKTNGAREDQEVPLYVWLPKGGGKRLPKSVELA
jgi:ribosomal protein S18 acetylase RimI-like enzyme